MKLIFSLLLILNIANCIHIHANDKHIRDLTPMPIADVEVDDEPLTAATQISRIGNKNEFKVPI